MAFDVDLDIVYQTQEWIAFFHSFISQYRQSFTHIKLKHIF